MMTSTLQGLIFIYSKRAIIYSLLIDKQCCNIYDNVDE